MTPDAFRRLALALPAACESTHGGHADFRRDNRIFGTLGYPDPAWAMIKLDREQQALIVAAEPEVFTPAKGDWGRRGNTLARLEHVDEATAKSALALAWANIGRARRR